MSTITSENRNILKQFTSSVFGPDIKDTDVMHYKVSIVHIDSETTVVQSGRYVKTMNDLPQTICDKYNEHNRVLADLFVSDYNTFYKENLYTANASEFKIIVDMYGMRSNGKYLHFYESYNLSKGVQDIEDTAAEFVHTCKGYKELAGYWWRSKSYRKWFKVLFAQFLHFTGFKPEYNFIAANYGVNS